MRQSTLIRKGNSRKRLICSKRTDKIQSSSRKLMIWEEECVNFKESSRKKIFKSTDCYGAILSQLTISSLRVSNKTSDPKWAKPMRTKMKQSLCLSIIISLTKSCLHALRLANKPERLKNLSSTRACSSPVPIGEKRDLEQNSPSTITYKLDQWKETFRVSFCRLKTGQDMRRWKT